MTNEDRKAEALARWLDADRGQEPPADLDADVVEAVYSLSPDRVPSARVSVDEILDLVVSGPLMSGSRDPQQVAQQTEAEVVPFPVPQAVSPTRSAHRAPPPSAQGASRPNVWWIGGGAVTFLAAAVALVVVLPTLFSLEAEPSFESEPIVRMSPMVRAPEVAIVQPPPPDAAAPALAVVESDGGATKANRSRAKEFSQGMDLGIITESGDGVDDDAVADLDGVDDSVDRGLLDLTRADEGLEEVVSLSARASKPSLVIVRGASRSAAPGVVTSSESSNDSSLASSGDAKEGLSSEAQPSPWPTSRSEAGQLLASAKAHLDAGRLERAEQAAQMGLKLEYQNTSVRSALLWVRGQAQAGQGDTAAAKRSYDEAIELNSTR